MLFRIMRLSPCGGTGRRARLKIVFRKEWGFDSLHGHHQRKSILKGFIFFPFFPTLVSRVGNFRPAFVPSAWQRLQPRAAAREWTEQFKRRVLAHLYRIALLRQRISTERRLLEECTVDRPAVIRHQRRAVRTRSFHFQTKRMHAITVHVLLAIHTAAAPRKGHNDMIAWH
jgi:hypothetical protein